MAFAIMIVMNVLSLELVDGVGGLIDVCDMFIWLYKL